MSSIRKQIHITGIVQGVGFRPFVWNRATQLGLVGWVKNDSSGVTIEIQGTPHQIDRFVTAFEKEIPLLAKIDSFSIDESAILPDEGFRIIPSSLEKHQSTPVSPEISICSDCLRELRDPANRRYRYPFINCTHCGPRFTIVEDIPYDRPLTTMKSFTMCRRCQAEYDDPSDRRFHAQPNACPECGPRIWFVSDPFDGQNFLERRLDEQIDSAIMQFRAAIDQGQVIGVKGIGGFHLACDATNDSAIETLRSRKGRVDKPFAIMVNNVEQAREFVQVGNQELELLESKERPIVLLQKKRDGKPATALSDLVAPGNNFVGVMLPYSPLHYLLLENSPPLVMTSGNLSDEPIVRTNLEACERLGELADGFLLHDRDIHVVCDDSVVRCVKESRILPVRRSRGYAPLPVKLKESGPSVLAVGGEIKSTFCVTKNDYAYVSQHIGDMGNLETLEAMQRSVDHFLRLFRVEVDAVAADLHPDYLSGRWARQFAESRSVPLIPLQHHFAHVVSLIAESESTRTRLSNSPPQGSPKLTNVSETMLKNPILGVCFDGTGYGTDECIWGGEFLLADEQDFVRWGHLQYVPLPGGDASIRKPYRAALAHLWAAGLDWDQRLGCTSACDTSELKLLRQQLEKNLRCISTSSMGRLFDTVASLIGIRQEVNYEAQAAMEMEAMAAAMMDHVDPNEYRFAIRQDTVANIECHDLIRRICQDVLDGIHQSIVAAQFHHAVANMVVEVGKLARDRWGCNTVGLTGGVFQNVLLLELTQHRLKKNGFDVWTHSIVPPNDGGIALGQAMIARTRMKRMAH